MILVTGNTYKYRAQLRAMGGEWDAEHKGWLMPDDQAEAARGLVAGRSQGRGRYKRPESGPGAAVNVATFSSGHSIMRNVRGTCIDAPCCGCCTF